jgi:hypothetical protein
LIGRTLALAVALAATSCAIHYVDSECTRCRVLNARLREGEHPTLPRLSDKTRHLFILVPGALGYSWEWNSAIRDLEAARPRGVEFVVMWWEPLGTVRTAEHEVAHWINDLLGANPLPELEQIDIVAHSMAGLIVARAAPALIAPPHGRMRISTIGTAFAGMIGPDFGYPDSDGSIALFSNFAPWLRYPPVPPEIDFVEYRTTWPEDPVMEPRFGHDPAPATIGPRPRVRVQLPHMDHNKCVGLVVDQLLKKRAQRSVEPGW